MPRRLLLEVPRNESVSRFGTYFLPFPMFGYLDLSIAMSKKITAEGRQRVKPRFGPRTGLQVHPIQNQGVEMDVEVERSSKALDEGDRAAL